MLPQDDIDGIARAVVNDGLMPGVTRSQVTYTGRYKGKVYSKGRPRVAATHTYTPPNTVKFEKAVEEFYEKTGATPVYHPVEVRITLLDRRPKSMTKVRHALADAELLYCSVGDVDNRAKSILDAGNGVLFGDDGQVTNLTVRRRYAVEGTEEGFSISVIRSGLSEAEIQNVQAAVVKLKGASK